MQYNYDYFISYAHADNKLPDGVPGFVNEFVKKLENGSEEHKRIFGGKIRIFSTKPKSLICRTGTIRSEPVLPARGFLSCFCRRIISKASTAPKNSIGG